MNPGSIKAGYRRGVGGQGGGFWPKSAENIFHTREMTGEGAKGGRGGGSERKAIRAHGLPSADIDFRSLPDGGIKSKGRF